jgi:hypothetical protein
MKTIKKLLNMFILSFALLINILPINLSFAQENPYNAALLRTTNGRSLNSAIN